MRFRHNNTELIGPGSIVSSGCASGVTPQPLGVCDNSVSYFSNGIIGQQIDLSVQTEKDEKIDRLVDQYESIIKAGRTRDLNTAADLLQHWLTGDGSDKAISDRWLRTFGKVVDALEVNHKRFMEYPGKNLVNTIVSTREATFQDFWDHELTGSFLTELFYASGTSTITSRGNFILDRSEQDKQGWIKINGAVEHHWWDPYDWHPGLTAFIPGFGKVADADAKFLEDEGLAKGFRMFSFWHHRVTGRYGIDTGLLNFDDQNISWSAPVSGRAPESLMGPWKSKMDALTDENNITLPGLVESDSMDSPIVNVPRRGWQRRNR